MRYWPFDRFGQIPEPGAIAQVIGSHRQHDVDRELPLILRFEQQFDESRFYILVVLASCLDAKQLFELIHQNEQLFVYGQLALAECLDQSQAAAPQDRFGHGKPNRDVCRVLGTKDSVGVQRARQITDGSLRGRMIAALQLEPA